MSLTVTADVLRRAIRLVQRIIPTRDPELPINRSALFAHVGTMLHISGTDMDTSMEVRIQVAQSGSGAACIPIAALSKMLKTVGSNEVTIDLELSHATISSDKFKLKIAGFEPGAFPKIAGRSSSRGIKLKRIVWARALRIAERTCSTDPLRAIFNGVKIKISDKGAVLTSTDGYRATRIRLPASAIEKTSEVVCIVPRKTIQVLRLSMGSSEYVELQKHDQFVDIKWKDRELDVHLVGRLLPGRFPNLAKVVAPSYEQIFDLDRRALSETVKRIEALATAKAKTMWISIAKPTDSWPQTIDIAASSIRSDSIFEYKDELAVSWERYTPPEGTTEKFGINVFFVKDMLRASRKTKLRCYANDNEACIQFNFHGEDDELDIEFFIMPVKP